MDTPKELFLKQVSRIVSNRFHLAAGRNEEDFISSYIRPLEQVLVESYIEIKSNRNRIPILIVVPNNIVSLNYQLKSIKESINDPQLEPVIKPGWFKNAKGILTPDKPYLLLDIQTGYTMINIAPKKCVEAFNREGRSPLTID